MSDPFDPMLSRDLTPILTERGPQRAAPQSGVPSASRDDLRVLTYQMELMQRKIQELEARREQDTKMEMLAARWEEFLSTSEYRFEKIQSQFQKQHELYKAHFRDLQSKLSIAMGWMKERHQADQTLFETIEQQRQSIQAFEAKMQQWQKILSEQELAVLNEESDKNRIEKMQAHLQRQHEVIQSAYREMQATVHALTNSVGERRNSDQSIREMVERQRQMVQSFEARLQQMQKVMSEQELQLMTSRTELRDALKELSRLRTR